MDDERTVESFLRKMVFPILALVYAVQAFACRALFADGAYNLFAVLQHQGFVFDDPRRLTNHVIVQLPLVALLKLGVHDLVFLRYVFSSWVLLCPLLVWGAALWKLRNDAMFWPFLFVFIFAYFNTDFFAIGEYGLCFALAAYSFAALARPLPANFAERAALMIAAALLCFHYPSTLFHGSLLCLLVFIKPDAEWNGASRSYKYGLAFLFAVSALSALWSVLAPSDETNFEQAQNGFYALHSMQFQASFLYALAGSVLYFIRSNWWRGIFVAVCVGSLIAIGLDPLRVYPFPHYALRAFIALALCACGVGLWWWRKTITRQAKEQRQVFLLPATLGMSLLLAMSWFDMKLSLDYSDYIDIFRDTLNSRTGLVPFERSGFPVLDYAIRFNWDWTYPVTSILLRENNQKAVILNPAHWHGYQPFDPKQGIPDLDIYYAD